MDTTRIALEKLTASAEFKKHQQAKKYKKQNMTVDVVDDSDDSIVINGYNPKMNVTVDDLGLIPHMRS